MARQPSFVRNAIWKLSPAPQQPTTGQQSDGLTAIPFYVRTPMPRAEPGMAALGNPEAGRHLSRVTISKQLAMTPSADARGVVTEEPGGLIDSHPVVLAAQTEVDEVVSEGFRGRPTVLKSDLQ